ncbi:unnamed protein product, partial [marine sediment metagenome]
MAEGDIGAQIDSLVFFVGTMQHSNIIHIAGDVYAVAFTDDGDSGIIITVEITEVGQIGASV